MTKLFLPQPSLCMLTSQNVRMQKTQKVIEDGIEKWKMLEMTHYYGTIYGNKAIGLYLVTSIVL